MKDAIQYPAFPAIDHKDHKIRVTAFPQSRRILIHTFDMAMAGFEGDLSKAQSWFARFGWKYRAGFLTSEWSTDSDVIRSETQSTLFDAVHFGAKISIGGRACGRQFNRWINTVLMPAYLQWIGDCAIAEKEAKQSAQTVQAKQSPKSAARGRSKTHKTAVTATATTAASAPDMQQIGAMLAQMMAVALAAATANA